VEPDDADDGVEDTDMTRHDVDADVRAEARRIVENLMRFALAVGVHEASTRDDQCGDHLGSRWEHLGSAELKDFPA
jgi:hypothetical protein